MRSKKNKKKFLIAITLGLIATAGVFSMINSQKAQVNELSQKLAAQSAALSTVQTSPNSLMQESEISNTILATTDIKAGEIITSKQIERKEYKKSELPPNFFPNENYVIGKTASQDILAGKIITSDDVYASAQNSINIPPGMRAITIPTTLIQGLASYIYVGSKIDLLTAKASPEFIAQNVKIVALETTSTPGSEASAPAPAAPAKPAQPSQAGQPVRTPSPATAQATPPETTPTSEGKANVSANKATGITILVPTITARRVIDAMLAGKLQVLTRGNNDDKIIKIKHTYSNTNFNNTKLPNTRSLTAGSILPPPPSGTGKLPPLPGSIPNRTTSNISTPTAPAQPKSGVEVIEASNKRQVTFDDYDTSSANAPSKDLKDLLKTTN